MLLALLFLLAPIPNSVVAPPVDTTTAPVTTAHSSPDACIYLDGCRTLFSIVQSCLLTIFACVWVAVHRNIPGPKQKWMAVHLEWLRVVVLTLLVPEWILAWAMRQFLAAWRLAKKLEAARVRAKHSWEESRTILAVEMDDGGASGEGKAAGRTFEIVEGDREDKIPLTKRRPTSMDAETAPAAGREAPDTLAMAERLARIDEPWTMAHAFFIIMGGFHVYDGKPLYPLSSEAVLDLVELGALVPPTLNELKDRSKGDALSKGLAIVQTLWFIAQCIARHIRHMSITNLEVMTLAYTVITLSMYAAWWNKPLNISCPIRVPGAAANPADAAAAYPSSVLQRIAKYVMGNLDGLATPSQLERVPTFWSGGTGLRAPQAADRLLRPTPRQTWEKFAAGGRDVGVANTIALAAAMVFGAVHWIAWSYTFPSHLEQLMWRMSAFTVVAAPAALIFNFVVANRVDWLATYITSGTAAVYFAPTTLGDIIRFVTYAACAIVYISARLALLVVSFTTLRSLPSVAYQTVRWTTFIPHI